MSDLKDAWYAATGPIYHVLDERGENMAKGVLRQTAIGWLYCDDIDGFEPVSNYVAEQLLTNCTTEVP